VSEQISRLLHYLRKSRCLVILDNVEMVLQGGEYVSHILGQDIIDTFLLSTLADASSCPVKSTNCL
jgi:hypothetical protein